MRWILLTLLGGAALGMSSCSREVRGVQNCFSILNSDLKNGSYGRCEADGYLISGMLGEIGLSVDPNDEMRGGLNKFALYVSGLDAECVEPLLGRLVHIKADYSWLRDDEVTLLASETFEVYSVEEDKLLCEVRWRPPRNPDSVESSPASVPEGSGD